jgi:hypothetical protein
MAKSVSVLKNRGVKHKAYYNSYINGDEPT